MVGGAGDDALLVAGAGPKSLSGGDGDDVLDAPGFGGDRMRNSTAAAPGRISWSMETAAISGQRAGGVTSEPDHRAGRPHLISSSPGGRRCPQRWADEYHERVSGTPFGDILTGGPGPDELLGQRESPRPDHPERGRQRTPLSGSDGEIIWTGNIGARLHRWRRRDNEFPKGSGGDTFLMRDGVLEKMSCSARDVVVGDLVDSWTGLETASRSPPPRPSTCSTPASRAGSPWSAHRTATTRGCPVRVRNRGVRGHAAPAPGRPAGRCWPVPGTAYAPGGPRVCRCACPRGRRPARVVAASPSTPRRSMPTAATGA